MCSDNQGFTTIECMVALTLFSIGALGAAATSGLAVRTAAEGKRAVRAARLLSTATSQLRLRVRQAGGSCPVLTGGRLSGLSGEQVVWRVSPGPGGKNLSFVVSFPTVRGQHADTTPGFLACR